VSQTDLHRALLEAVHGEKPRSDETAAARKTLHARVLVAEDSAVNAEIALEMLREAGCTVIQAENGNQAVARYHEHQRGLQPFDLILMDCEMPELDGFAATVQIRQLEAERAAAGDPLPRVPIIALTANALSGDRERCISIGMDDYLAKPFKKTDLRAVVKRWSTTQAARVPTVAPLETPAEPVAFDRHVLLENVTINGRFRKAMAEKLIALFLKETPKLIAAITEGLAKGDNAAVRRATHQLKSSSASLGGLALSALARKIEFDANEDRLDDAPGRGREIEAQFAALTASLEAFRAELSQAEPTSAG
jgi:two-component system, sensor histidine kinase and response regulator